MPENVDQNNSEYGHFLSSEYSKYERTEVLGNAVKMMDSFGRE